MRAHRNEQDCRRSEPRNAMNCMALAFSADGRRTVVTISDMSLSGVRIDGATLDDDDAFRLVIPHRGDIDAKVRWASSGGAGARFDQGLGLDGIVPAREEHALKRSRAFNFGSGRAFGSRGIAQR